MARTFGWQGGGKRGLEFPDGAPVAGPFVGLSPEGRGRIRYNKALNRFEKSLSGADWEALVAAPGVSVWMEAAGVVSLVTTTNDVVVGPGTIVGSERLRVVGESLLDGDVTVAGKLTVTGAIDPPSVLLSGGTALFYESNDGSTAPVSGVATGRIRYNDTSGTWQVSTQTSAYVNIALATGTPAYAVTNVSTDRAYDADSTTVNEISDVLGTLIADLAAKGIIG